MRCNTDKRRGRPYIQRLGDAESAIGMDRTRGAAGGIGDIINGDNPAERAGRGCHACSEGDGGRRRLRTVFQEAGGKRRSDVV